MAGGVFFWDALYGATMKSLHTHARKSAFDNVIIDTGRARPSRRLLKGEGLGGGGREGAEVCFRYSGGVAADWAGGAST